MCSSRRSFFRPLPGMKMKRGDITAEETEILLPSIEWERVNPEKEDMRSNFHGYKGNILPAAAVVFLLFLLFLAK